MAAGGLIFRAPCGNIEPEDLPDGIVLRGEVEWFVEGNDAEIGALLTAVGSLGVKVSAGVARLRFGNVVGTFALGTLGVVRVRCGKWDEAVFDALLEDITRKILALPFSAAQATGIPHDRSIADRDDVLLHAFVYARHILLAAQGDQSLAHALALVVRDPHRLFRAERAVTSLVAARRVDARTVARIVAGADGVGTATGHAARTALATALHGHLPTHVDVPRVEHTFDTAENRFVLEFIKQLRALIDHVESLARSEANPSMFWSNTIKDCAAMRRVLGRFERHDVWIDIGRMAHVPIGSSVLQRRRGYKDILHHHLALRAAVRIPLDKNAVENHLLGVKDVASLYELWCYFAVVDAVRDVLGREPDMSDSPRADVDKVALPWAFRVAWHGGPTVYYNLSFSRKRPAPRGSSSLSLRPDIVIEIERGGVPELHVFDAKLRVDGLASIDDDTEDDAEAHPLTFKKDDVAKMHAYRDALPAVRSARVLYPGHIAREFLALEPDAIATDVVGAIPLVPGATAEHLLTALTQILPLNRVRERGTLRNTGGGGSPHSSPEEASHDT
jgi:predicted component of viral defense system (DUF524 family)